MNDLRGLVSLDRFCAGAGVSAVTARRWADRGMVKIVDVLGQKYVTGSEIARFEQRAARGEFARKTWNRPPARGCAAAQSALSTTGGAR
jgi:hypothetical protein